MVCELGIGGSERDVTKLAQRLDRTRFTPHVGCLREQGVRADELRQAGIPIVRFPVTSFRSPSFLQGVFAFRQYVKNHQIRLLQTFDVPSNIFGIAGARITGLRPAIASQLWFLDTIPHQLWSLHRLSLRFADAVVVNSDAVRNQLMNGECIRAARIHVSHNGVETELFHPDTRSASSSPAHRPVVGAVCALRPEKRLDLLLDAFARAKKQHPEIQLLIVGSGEMLSQLEQQRDQLGLGADCTFVPAQKDVPPWMRKIDIFVMCSRSESFPNALLEAMACRCCVIGSDVGGIPELIEAGESGLLFRPGDAADLSEKLLAVLRDSALRERLARNAAARASQKFSIEEAVSRMEGIYTSLLFR